MLSHPLQIPGIKINHIPANQHVRIILRHPIEECSQQLGLRLQCHHIALLRTFAAHEYLTCHFPPVAAVHRNGIQLQAIHGRLDIVGDHPKLRFIECRFHFWVVDNGMLPALSGLPVQQCRPGNKALHKIALCGIDVRLQRIKPFASQQVCAAPGLPVAGKIHCHNRLQLKITQWHRLELHPGLPDQ